jgi:hypothetical protein
VVDWVGLEASGVFGPDPADVFVGGEALEGLEALGEVVGGVEVGEVASELLVAVVRIAPDGRLLEGAVPLLCRTRTVSAPTVRNRHP